MLTQVVSLLESKVDATVTFKPTAPESVITQAKFYLTSLQQQVDTVEYIPAEEVLARFKATNKNNDKILSGLQEVDGNPLGGQLIIKAKRPEHYPFLLQAIQGPQYQPFVQSQTYDDHAEAINTIREVARNVRIVGAVLVALFAAFGLLIAFNAVRVAIYTQREEIAIMRLVGASTGFIRGPFVLEAVWLATISLLLCAGLVIGVIHWLEPILAPWFEGRGTGLVSFYLGQWPLVIGLQAGSLVLLVMVVAWMAVGRYIRR